MRNVTLSLVAVSLYSAFGWKMASGSKIAFTKNTDPVHEQIYLSLIFDFFCPHIDCHDMAVTQLSPTTSTAGNFLTELLSWKGWMLQKPCQTAHMSTAFGSDSSIINLLGWTVGTMWKVPVRSPCFLGPTAQEYHDWTMYNTSTSLCGLI